MDEDIAIKVEHVSKKYCKSLKRSMLYGLQDIGRNAMGLSSHSDKLRKNEFWAVDDISFEVRKGETLGIIGPNGAGKTTLLKMLNGIFWPDKGKINIKGRVGALIEVGAGFHPLLTGRENIYVNGAILGMSKGEIDKKFDTIVEFADIGDFLDTPVKYYSSGMFVRLGFSIAIHIEPDILLVDEILSVGDVNFRIKSTERINELVRKGAATIFVSHNLHTVDAISDRIFALKNGTIVIGPDNSRKVLEKSYSIFSDQVSAIPQMFYDNRSRQGKLNDVIIERIQLLAFDGKEKEEFSYDEPFCVRVWYQANRPISHPSFGIEIRRQDGLICLMNRSSISGFTVEEINGHGFFEMQIDGLFLAPLRYSVRAVINDCTMSTPLTVKFGQSFQVTAPFPYDSGILFPITKWKVSS